MRVRLGTMMLLAGSLAGSAAMADSPPPPPEPQPKTFCMEVYQPVCGTKDGNRKTYSNRCFANVDQATDIADGPCGPADGGPTKPQ
jgi:Kazal-type serine protease inhibitor domain